MNLRFQDYISIKLHKTDLVLTSFIKSKLEPFNLAPEQNLIMMLLWEQDGLTQNQLGKMLNKDKTNITRMTSSLEKKELIKRLQWPQDKRVTKIYLTSKGSDLGNQVIPVAEQFNKVVCKDLSGEELAELDRLLTKISRNVQSI
ncbi:MarR family transcriptional regulator [Jeotgalibacillus sp. ET6]|nr:MarR family transcriptional regulator [Jeotgalibacillus sp. ET6]MDG5473534.1 MarR family transcriptional regulator [Jeotgalibacillus sp. ET6]